MPASLRESLRGATYTAALRTPLAKWLLPAYRYQYAPADLCVMVAALDQTEPLEGSILEVGCFQGATTVFLAEHLRARGSEKRYYALDTFSGFTDDDVAGERARGRTAAYTNFRRNSIATFRRTMALNRITRVTAIEADAKSFDYASLAPFSFCLVDVDLYEPVRATLEAVHDLMTPGGVIVVDDCDRDSTLWRGAYEAYTEFVDARGLPVDIRSNMLGMVQC